jgi:hypothetical protein
MDCGYTLAGITSAICPECGAVIELVPRRKRPMAGLAVLLAALGISGLILSAGTFLAIALCFEHNLTARNRALAGLGAAGFGYFAWTVFVTLNRFERRWRAFSGLPINRQFMLIVGHGLLASVLVLIVFLLVRISFGPLNGP